MNESADAFNQEEVGGNLRDGDFHLSNYFQSILRHLADGTVLQNTEVEQVYLIVDPLSSLKGLLVDSQHAKQRRTLTRLLDAFEFVDQVSDFRWEVLENKLVDRGFAFAAAF